GHVGILQDGWRTELFVAALLRLFPHPAPEPRIDFFAIEQIHVVHAVADPLPSFRKRQISALVLVLAERAGERNEAVAEQLLGRFAGFLRDRSGDRITRYVV